MNTIRKRQLQFLGHVMRKEGLDNLAIKGRIDGTRSGGRSGLLNLESFSKWIAEGIPGRAGKMKKQDLLKATRDRKSWRTMIATVLKGYGT